MATDWNEINCIFVEQYDSGILITTTMTAVLDKNMIEKALKELAIQEPEYVSDLIRQLGEELKIAKRKRLEEIVKEDFEEYGEVFKALA
jgi:spore germination protein GerM